MYGLKDISGFSLPAKWDRIERRARGESFKRNYNRGRMGWKVAASENGRVGKRYFVDFYSVVVDKLGRSSECMRGLTDSSGILFRGSATVRRSELKLT